MAVFISLRFGEAMDEAKLLKHELEALNIPTFLCDVPEGLNIAAAIATALHACKLVVVMGTLTYGKDTGLGCSTFEEIQFIKSEKKPMFLVKMCDKFELEFTRLFIPDTVSYFRWPVGTPLPPLLVQHIADKLVALQGLPDTAAAVTIAVAGGSSAPAPTSIPAPVPAPAPPHSAAITISAPAPASPHAATIPISSPAPAAMPIPTPTNAANPARPLAVLISRDNAASLRPVHALAHAGDVNAGCFSPDGLYVLTGCDRNRDNAILWNLSTGQRCIKPFEGHLSHVRSCCFSPDTGSLCLTGSLDKTAIVWDVENGAQKMVLTEHTDSVYACCFSPDGKLALTGSADDRAIVWDLTSGKKARVLSGHESQVLAVACSPLGRTAVTGSKDRTAIIWELSCGRRIATIDLDSVAYGACYSPDGRSILFALENQTAVLHDAMSGDLIRIFHGHTDIVWACCFSPDGRLALTGSEDKTAIVWDVATGAKLATLSGHSEKVRGCAWSPLGRVVLTCSWDKTAIVWCI